MIYYRAMSEFNPFRSDRAPLTNWVGHQWNKAVSAGAAGIQKIKDPAVDFKHTYELRLMQEQKTDFVRGNTLTAIALLAASIVSNSIR